MTTNKILIVLCFLLSLQLQAQKYYTRSGSTQFEGSEKAFEPIAATNTSTTVILDTRNGNIVSQVFMAGFQFKNALMQEHFNENYLESDKFPKSSFSGFIGQLNDGAIATGTLKIHGVANEVEVNGSLEKTSDSLIINATFVIQLKDYKIKIPRVVMYNIAEEIEVTVKAELKKI